MTDGRKPDHERSMTLHLCDDLVRKAEVLMGQVPINELLRQALIAIIERESARRLAALTPEYEELRDDRPIPVTRLSMTRRSVEWRPAELCGDTECAVDEAPLSELVAELKEAVVEARSKLRDGLSEVRNALEELRTSRRR